MPKSENAREASDRKCYFSTFIDEETITCSTDGRFDSIGFPIKLCDKLDFCDKIKEMNKGLNLKIKNEKR